jgi:Flp pilus assembly protein TadG
LGRIVSRSREDRGTAVIEFAIIAPILFLLVLGVLDFARALDYYNNLTQLAGQGARAAAVNQNPDSSGPSGQSIQTQIWNAAAPEMRSHTPPLQVCIDTMPSSTGDPVTVRARYQFNFLPGLSDLPKVIGLGPLPSNIELSASQTERFEAISPSFGGGCFSP